MLDAGDFGIVSIALVVTGIAAMFAQLGVGPAVVQRTDLRIAHLDAAWLLSIVFGLLTAGVIYLAAPALAGFFRTPELIATLRALCLVFPIAGVGVVTEALIQRDLRFDLVARAEVFSYLAGFGIVAVALAWFGWGAWALVWGQVAQSWMKTELLFKFHPWRPSLRFSRQAGWDLARFSSGLTIARLANYLASNGDRLVAGRFLGPELLGIYGRAYQLMVQPANIVGSVLEKVLFPAMAKVQEDLPRLAAVFRQGSRLLASVMLPGTAILWLTAPEMVRVLLGEKWDAVIPPFQILSLALLFRTSMKLSNSLIRARGAVFHMAWMQGLYAAATIGFAWAGQGWGVAGISTGVLASIALCYTLGSILALRLTGLHLGHYVWDHLPGAALGLAVLLAGWLPCNHLRAQGAGDAVVLAVTLAAMFAVAGAAIACSPRTFLGPEGERLRAAARTLYHARASRAPVA